MALRVLLADESSTIKKVIQLALQDFAVEVKSVHSGVDVLEVAKTFKPDLIFADVLLQKRNGYEAAAELKSAFETKSVPIILMWSSFMELDEQAFQRSHADGRLEKPFDAETLRNLVTDLVPKTRASALSQHLEFPSSVFPKEPASKDNRAELTSDRRVTAPPAVPSGPVKRAPEGPRVFELDDEESPFQFSELPKNPPSGSQPTSTAKPQASQNSAQPPKAAAPAPKAAPAPERPTRNWEDITMPKVDENDENWSHQNLQQFNVNLEPLKIESDNVSIEFHVQHGELEGEKRLLPQSAPAQERQERPDETISRTGYLAPQSHTQTSASSLPNPYDMPHTQAGIDSDSESESVLSSFETEDSADMDIPRMNPAFDPPPNSFAEERRSGSVPQMSVDELERIVRAQSREIIEALVRKIVPDLASQMIREELSRLIGPN